MRRRDTVILRHDADNATIRYVAPIQRTHAPEEPDAWNSARPDLWGARAGNRPGLPDTHAHVDWVGCGRGGGPSCCGGSSMTEVI